MKLLPDSLLDRLNAFVSEQMGLHFSPSRRVDLQRGVASAALEFGFDDIEDCVDWLTSSQLSQRQVEILASHLTIGETYFFREQPSFEAFEANVLRELIRARRGGDQRLRLWSAGCCTGEEPYSMAISVMRALPDLSDWDVTILATDINPRFLKRASDGVFNEWSFRSVTPAIKTRYFTEQKPGSYRILPSIQRMVSFAYLNLAEDNYPSLSTNTTAMDVILCRNVIIYLNSDQTTKLTKRFWRCLADEGWLFVGAAEASQSLFSAMEMVKFPGTIAYQKRAGFPIAQRPYAGTSADRSLSTPNVITLDDFCPSSKPDSIEGLAIPLQSEKQEEDRDVRSRDVVAQAAELHAEGDYAAVVQKLNELVACDEANAAVHIQLVRAHANLGDIAGASQTCERAIATDKLNPRLHYLRAIIAQEQSDAAQVLASLKSALYLDPGFVMAYFAMGQLYWRQGKHSQACKHMGHVLRLLQGLPADAILPESEGISAGQLTQIIASARELETAT